MIGPNYVRMCVCARVRVCDVSINHHLLICFYGPIIFVLLLCSMSDASCFVNLCEYVHMRRRVLLNLAMSEVPGLGGGEGGLGEFTNVRVGGVLR